MIPLRLELRNFMSYGENVPPLDFAGMRTICLSGDNGNGKSALLDAITWCLWGESRAGKNKHDELVRLGADEMSVTFTFDMDGQVFRVLRKRSKKASGNQWELQQQMDGGTWRSLTGNHAGETDRAIQKLLRMSYDTFINSAYLRQGQADQFVRQAPGKRKEILAAILDLSRYDQLETKARDKARAAAAEATDLQRDINAFLAEIAHEPEHLAALATLNGHLENLVAKRDVLHQQWEIARDRKTILEERQKQSEVLCAQLKALDQEILDLQVEQEQAEEDRSRALSLIDRKEEITRDHEALEDLRRQLDDLTRDLERWNQTRQQKAAAEKRWLLAEAEVKRDADRASQELSQAEGRLRDLPTLQTDHDVLTQKAATLDSLVRERKARQAELDRVSERFQSLREQNAAADQRAKQWQERIAQLDRQRGVCQVCNSPLPPDKIAATRAEYVAEEKAATEACRSIRQEGSQSKQKQVSLQDDLAAMDARITAARGDEIRLGQIAQRLLELNAITLDLPTLRSVSDQAQRRFVEKEFAPEVRRELEGLDQILRTLEHVQENHRIVRDKLTKLADAERLFLALEQARISFAAAESRRERAEKSLTGRRATRAKIADQLKDMHNVAPELLTIGDQITEIRRNEMERSKEELAVRAQQTQREDSMRRCRDLKSQRDQSEKKLNKIKTDQEAYEQLSLAFGKKGVQALIIENAIPELQEEANRLLERLTDGDMSLYFDTLRDGKSKKTGQIETLDIKVSDNLGTRPLEMYSGGESFRAAFAIRIALSKLLAHRAGARLQTLIIDEGFGTQDGKGREKLVDAVNTVQEEFKKIIVITHIDELKDAFATRIEVTKTPQGSQFTVLEGAAG